MKNIEAIIFDMDGVIFDTERVYLEIWTEVFKDYGYKMTKEIYTSVMGVGRSNVIKKFLEIYGEELPIEKMYKEKDDKLSARINEGKIPLKYGVCDILEYLKGKNYKIALATSARKERVHKHLEQAEIKKYFDVIVCGDEVEKSKPNPEVFLKASEKLSAGRSKCIVVEDSKVGVKAGYNAGMRVVNIPDLKEADKDMKRYSNKVLTDLIELKKYIKMNKI